MKLKGFTKVLRLYENKPKQTNICFVNFSNGVYINGQKDLVNSLKKYSEYDILTFTK
mgnify:FL=1